MPVFLTILKILVLTALVLILLAAVIPVRYRAAGKIAQKEPVEHLEPEKLLSCTGGELRASWLLGAVRLRAAYPDDGGLRFIIFGIPMALPKRKTAKEGRRTGRRASFSLRSFCDSIRNAQESLAWWSDFIQREETGQAVSAACAGAARLMRAVIPKDYAVRGTAGLGDPFLTAKMLQAEGMLYPFTDGRIAVEPYFGEPADEGESVGRDVLLDIQAHAAGRIHIPVLLYTAFRLFKDPDIRRVRALLAKRPDRHAARGGEND